jgi:hypothetical protein
MRKTAFMVLIAWAVLAAAACKENPTGPSADSPALAGTMSKELDTTTTITKVEDLTGIWQATKAEGRNYWDPRIRRDLVAEGGTVTLVLEEGQSGKTYSATLTMPGETPRINTGRWHDHEFWGRPQIDFWPSSIPIQDLEYGDGIGFYSVLNGNTLSLSEGGGAFLLFDFGWHDPWDNDWAILDLVLTRE